ncbi:MAG: hypothetical protein AAGK05_13720, partial [Pseudomonadota bacterium]
MMEANASFLEEDKVTDLSDLKKKITDACVPSDYSVIERENVILFVCVSLPDSDKEPKILTSVSVNSSLNVTAYVESKRIPMRELSHILTNGRIGTVVELTNVLAHCKSLLDTHDQRKKTTDLDIAISSLKRFIKDSSEGSCHSNESLIQFVIEQLHFCQMNDCAIRLAEYLLAYKSSWHKCN